MALIFCSAPASPPLLFGETAITEMSATSSAGVIEALPPLESSCCLMVLSTCFKVMSREPTFAATSSVVLSEPPLQAAISNELKRTKVSVLRERNTVMLLSEESDKSQFVVDLFKALHSRTSDKLKFVGRNGLTDDKLPVLNCRFAFIEKFSSEVRTNVETL